MKDFEVHPIGTLGEIKLSRELAREIEQVTQQHGNTIPSSILDVYYKLREYYAKQIEAGML